MAHPYLNRLFFFFLLLLCSCVSARKAKKYFDKHPEELALYVEENEEYTEQYGAAYAAKHFPPKLYPPAIEPKTIFVPDRISPYLMPPENGGGTADAATNMRSGRCPECKSVQTIKTVYLQDTSRLTALRVMLDNERAAFEDVTQQLNETEAERDYWREQNRKKFWTLIAMAAFAALYILFRILGARVRET